MAGPLARSDQRVLRPLAPCQQRQRFAGDAGLGPETYVTTIDLSANSLRSSVPSARTRLIYALFFFSGFPALIYQLTWQRSLFRIFGVNTESVTIVVTAFMLGLGLGIGSSLPLASRFTSGS